MTPAVIIVDDRLCLDALAGRAIATATSDDIVATTWGFHYRLLRALAGDRIEGALSRAVPDAVRARAANPTPARLVVLDPRQLTAAAATLAARHGLNLLAAELLAAAQVHASRVVVSAGNVGQRWPAIFAAEGVALTALPQP